MELLSFGDCIKAGSYMVHSQFDAVVNFRSGRNFVSVVTPGIDSSPVNIVFSSRVELTNSSLEIWKDEFCFNSEIFLVDKSKIYNSSIPDFDINLTLFNSGLKYFESALVENSHPKSLTVLFDCRRESAFVSTTEKIFVQRFYTAIDNLISYNSVRGIELLKGLGFGLTPSGDDFISGYLIALNFLEKLIKDKITESKELIYSAALSKNDFVNSFLSLAFTGNITRKFKNVIEAILSGNKESIYLSTIAGLKSGETSGADQLSGFLFALTLRSKECLQKEF